MEFGIFSPPERRPWSNWTLGFDQDIEEIRYAEELGFDEYWIGEHHNIDWETCPDPGYMIAKASAVTDRINLGTGVVTLPIHDPVQTAERFAFLDHLTHGRLLPGVGTGAPPELALFDVAQERKRERMAEATDIVSKFFTTDGPVSHDGEFYSFSDKQLQFRPYQRPPPPIAVAGSASPFSFELAVEQDYWPMSIYYALLAAPDNPDVNGLVSQAEIMRERAGERGIDPSEVLGNWRIFREVYVAETTEQALADIREGAQETYLDYLRDQLGFADRIKRDIAMDDDEVTFEYLVEETPWIVGSPEDVIEQIRDLEAAVGEFGCLVVTSRREWVSKHQWENSLDLFARTVMPAFQPEKTPLHR